jgi:hypothetical protein
LNFRLPVSDLKNQWLVFKIHFSERGCVPGTSRSTWMARKAFGLAEALRLVCDTAALRT